MPKVVHLTTVHSANDVRIFQKECTSLAEAGYKVVLFAPHSGQGVNSGVEVKIFPMPRRRLARMTKGVVQLWRLARQEQAELYHFHDPELLPMSAILSKLGMRVVYDIHEDVPLDIRDKDYLPRWSRNPISKFADIVERFCARYCAAVVPATDSIAERATKFGPRVSVVPNYPRLTDIGIADTAWSERANWVTFVGGLNNIRGGREMVLAMSMVSPHVKATLQLVGSYSEAFRRELSQTPGWDRVQERGVLKRADVAQVLSRSCAGIVVYHPVANNIEAEPNKLFEYMAAGIPVIASNFPRWRRLIEREGCGLTVDPLDPRSTASAIEYILSHPEHAREMGVRGRRAVEQRYNWTIAERGLLQLYSDLLRDDAEAGTPQPDTLVA
jgi:glycosyltransferase involved in cell wall biosynthesis